MRLSDAAHPVMQRDVQRKIKIVRRGDAARSTIPLPPIQAPCTVSSREWVCWQRGLLGAQIRPDDDRQLIIGPVLAGMAGFLLCLGLGSSVEAAGHDVSPPGPPGSAWHHPDRRQVGLPPRSAVAGGRLS